MTKPIKYVLTKTKKKIVFGTKITRFELIGNGREVVLYEDMNYLLSDDGRTLKVFRKAQQ